MQIAQNHNFAFQNMTANCRLCIKNIDFVVQNTNIATVKLFTLLSNIFLTYNILKGFLIMAVKKNDVKPAEKSVKKEAAAPVKAVKEEKAAVKATEKKAEEKPVEKKEEKKAAKPAAKKEDKKAAKPAAKKEDKKASAKAVAEEKPAKKAAPAKKPAKKAEKAETEVYFEFAGRQVKAADVTKAVEAACKANGVKSADVKGVKVYVKAEDNAAYYVLANGESGKIDL